MQRDTALWMALGSLEEKAARAAQLAERTAARGSALSQARFHDQAAEARKAANSVRKLLESRPVTSVELVDD
ncbi:hypothetical protein [Terrabacter sp. BE26]|uniref:hypothetical protein n=1 Tax=Terrabacter sp. BE26 TaxID=2898152 RepID=UPI0035BE92D9